MNDGLMWALSIFGLLLIALLLISIRRNSTKLSHAAQLKRNQQQEKKVQRAKLEESLHVLAVSMLDGQIETSEGCYRIKVLLDFYDPDLHERAPFSIFNTVYEGLKHMPTHEARKQTEKRFVFKLDKQRHALEQQHHQAIMSASQALVEHLRHASQAA